MADRPVRLADFSGYFGDRFTAVDEVLAGDPVDVPVGYYPAETISRCRPPVIRRTPVAGMANTSSTRRDRIWV